jgi:quercetin dioxygenase-like cupin family protein
MKYQCIGECRNRRNGDHAAFLQPDLFSRIEKVMTNTETITPIVRKPLLTVPFGSKSVTAVDVREIRFGPHQQTGRHKHPCPVIGYVVEGTAVLEVEGQPVVMLPAGSSFYEPAETVIARFENAGDGPMTFIAHYPLEGKQELIEMLPAK